MFELTIGQVAGIINTAVIITQLTIPLAIAFLIAGVLKESNNAVTWSVVGRVLNGSFWPTILRTDTAATAKVSKRVVSLSALSTVALIFLGLISVITPLGLYENISRTSFKEVEFGYVPDLQSMGKGTPERSEYTFGRLCGVDLINCPGQDHGLGHGFKFSLNATTPIKSFSELGEEEAYISTVLPSNITDIFSSGSQGNRNQVAGAFDIQYRSFFLTSYPWKNSTADSSKLRAPNIDQGRKRTQSTFRMYESLILNDQVNVVEGLVVDAKVGGIGFRNHTVPLDPGNGSEWTEGLLWIQPETVCVSTNLSTDFIAGETVSEITEGTNIKLTDRGGFVDFIEDYFPINLNDTQNRPELLARAHNRAITHNANLMRKFERWGMPKNKSTIGTSYDLGWKAPSLQGILISRLADWEISKAPSTKDYYSEFYNDMLKLTGDSSPTDLADIANIAVETGIMFGNGRRVDEGPDRSDQDSTWSAPIYACATALKAYIMDVSFLINETNLLTNLQVSSMEPRNYSSETSVPLWAVEDTGLKIADAAPFWAVVDDKYEFEPHMWTSRKDHLYLPAGSGPFGFNTSRSACASAYAPESVLNAVYSELRSDPIFPDYSGLTNYPMFLKWQKLSKSPDTASTIINLIWTDIIANLIVGTKSTLNAHNKFAISIVNSTRQDGKGPMIRVFRHDRRIRYDLRYGIPGIIFLAFYVATILSALIFWIIGRVRFQYLRTILNQTAAGRIVTVERHGDAARAPALGTRKWIQEFGEEDIGLRNPRLAEKKKQNIESESEPAVGESSTSTMMTTMTTTSSPTTAPPPTTAPLLTITTPSPTTTSLPPPENDQLLSAEDQETPLESENINAIENASLNR